MQRNSTLLLNSLQINQKVNRIAYQIFEDNFNESELIIAGIANSGFFCPIIKENIRRDLFNTSSTY